MNISGSAYYVDTAALSSQGSNFTGAAIKGQALMTAFQPGSSDAVGQSICGNIGMYEPLLSICHAAEQHMLNKTIFVFFEDNGFPVILLGLLLVGMFIYIRRQKDKKVFQK